MLRRSLVPGRQTNVDAKHAPVINFPRVNVSTRSPGQRLLFVHQFSIHFHSRGSPCDRSGCDASRKRTEETGISAKPSLAFNMWRPCAIVRGRSAPDTSASWLTSMWKHYYSTIVADGYLKSRVSNTRFSLRPMKGDGFEERSSKFPSFAIFYRSVFWRPVKF